MKHPDPETVGAARKLFRSSWQGVLSTLSVELGGAPFGSVASFSVDRAGAPVFLASGIAEHSRNLEADARVSLIAIEGGDDVQSSGRVTLVGHAVAVPAADADDVAARHYRRFPHAAAYHRAHDFTFYRIEVKHVRYIGGFGRIHWIEPAHFLEASAFSAEEERGMVDHMNADHADALRLYCRLFGIEPGADVPRLSAIDEQGFDLMIGKRLARIDFDAPAPTPVDVRKAMVALVQRARQIQGQTGVAA